MKAQMNIEFILGVSVLVMIISFIGFSILNHFPSLHMDAVYEMERAKSFELSNMLVMDSGLWSSANISNCSRLGLTNGAPYILNASKIMALNNCSLADYNLLRKSTGIESGADFIINVTLVNFTGGGDTKISECRPMMVSLTAPKFLSRRFAVMENLTRQVVRIEVTIFGYS